MSGDQYIAYISDVGMFGPTLCEGNGTWGLALTVFL